MKKIFIILLVVSLFMSVLAGCGTKDGGGGKQDQQPGGKDNTVQDEPGVITTEHFKFDSTTNSILGPSDSAVGVTDITIPSQIEGHAVTRIAPNAFNGRQLTSVVFPDTLVEIGGNSFKDNKLSEVTIPASVTVIEYNAFLKNNLTEVTIPDSITDLAMGVFRDNQITTINWPTNLTIIGRSAFEKNSLTELTLPDTIRLIHSSAFKDNSLATLNLNEGLERIDGRAFENNNLTSITIPASVTTIGVATEGTDPPKHYERYVFTYNQLTEITILGDDTFLEACLLGEHNYLRDAYNEGGAGTYTGTQEGPWEKSD